MVGAGVQTSGLAGGRRRRIPGHRAERLEVGDRHRRAYRHDQAAPHLAGQPVDHDRREAISSPRPVTVRDGPHPSVHRQAREFGAGHPDLRTVPDPRGLARRQLELDLRGVALPDQ